MGIFSRRKKASKAPAKKTAKKSTATKRSSTAASKKLRPQCAALTASGSQCANSARSGSKYCASHKGYQPPARGKARGTNTKPAVGGAKDTAASGRRPAGTKQCAAKTKSGTQCRRDANPRGKYCAQHKGYRA